MLSYNDKSNGIKELILEIISALVVNMIVIALASYLFKNIYVENLFYTFIASLFLIVINKCIKPIIKIIMLPLNIFTLGITYPFVNVIVLKLLSLLMGNHFIIGGWFSAFFISIFISIMTIIIDRLIGIKIREV